MSEKNSRFADFSEFYPFYLQEHQNVTCRRLHFVGSCLVLVLLVLTIITGMLWLLLLLPIVGYGFAWVSNF